MGTLFSCFWLALNLALGCLAYAALFSSNLGLPEKLFLGASLLLIASHLDLNSLHAEFTLERLLEANETALGTVQRTTAGTVSLSVSEALDGLVRRRRFELMVGGSGVDYVVVLLGKYAVWLGGGWAIARYFVPEVLRNVL